MDDTTIVLREGDVYRWSYREPGDDRGWGRYHCCSRIAIVHKGLLRDTYWQAGNSFSSDGRLFTEDELDRLNLTHLGNLSDLERAKEYQGDYYSDADIVNLNHSNSSGDNFYLRRGAKRSQEKMLATAHRKLEQARSDERMAVQRIQQFLRAIADIEAGDLNVHL